MSSPQSEGRLGKSFDLVSTLLGGLADIIWPPHCVVCGTLHSLPLCPSCVEMMERIVPPVCRVCGIPMDDVGTCRWCMETEHVFRCARAVAAYSGVMEQAVRRLKFGGCKSLAPVLGGLMADLAQESKVLANRAFDLVVPVPMHSSDMLKREFNQSELLARELAARIGLRCRSDLLRKVRKTRPQVGLTAERRRENLRGAFAVVSEDPIAHKDVLLVDDVMTTGATADECARTLLAAGCGSVYAITAARQV